MAAKLPPKVQLRVEQTLDQYSHWQVDSSLPERPEAVRLLSGGRSNFSLKASAAEQHFVIRVDGPNIRRLGLNRKLEWHVQLSAWRRGLAPRPVYFNPELGVLVSRYCEAESWHAQPEVELGQVAELLRRIHALPAVKYRLQPLDRARHYAGLLHQGALPKTFESLCLRLQRTAITCLCHNDLLRANRLYSGGQLLALDWEYAAMGDPWFELAVICEGDALGDDQRRQLLTRYLSREPGRKQWQRLSDYCRVYGYLTELWERITEATELAR
ncbi:MAG: phosphotransferase family protein [Halieaceae bacterium]|nr:phosphotransferase family protein [Halieaceae bacterium]